MQMRYGLRMLPAISTLCTDIAAKLTTRTRSFLKSATYITPCDSLTATRIGCVSWYSVWPATSLPADRTTVAVAPTAQITFLAAASSWQTRLSASDSNPWQTSISPDDKTKVWCGLSTSVNRDISRTCWPRDVYSRTYKQRHIFKYFFHYVDWLTPLTKQVMSETFFPANPLA